MITRELYTVFLLIINFIQSIESDPVFERKDIGNNMFFVTTEDTADFYKLAQIKFLTHELLDLIPKEELQTLFLQKGYNIHYNTTDILKNSGYIETKKA